MASLASTPPTHRIVHYDRMKRRLWVRNQRVHHGLTGAFLAAAGTALMLHDWKDHSLWFVRGPGSQP